jgi:hypothetical protein
MFETSSLVPLLSSHLFLLSLLFLTLYTLTVAVFYYPGIGRQPIKVEVRSDKGTYSGSLALDYWSTQSPLPLSASETLACRSKMGGFSEVNGSVNLTGPINRNIIIERVRRLLNVCPADGNEEYDELLFAGCSRKANSMSEDRLLIGVRSVERLVLSKGLF